MTDYFNIISNYIPYWPLFRRPLWTNLIFLNYTEGRLKKGPTNVGPTKKRAEFWHPNFSKLILVIAALVYIQGIYTSLYLHVHNIYVAYYLYDLSRHVMTGLTWHSYNAVLFVLVYLVSWRVVDHKLRLFICNFTAN